MMMMIMIIMMMMRRRKRMMIMVMMTLIVIRFTFLNIYAIVILYSVCVAFIMFVKFGMLSVIYQSLVKK